jgi:hypothetical protein
MFLNLNYSGIPNVVENLFIFDLLKYIWSTGITLGSLEVICYWNLCAVITAEIIAIFTMCILIYLEGLIIAIVSTQYWDLTVFKKVYPRATKSIVFNEST